MLAYETLNVARALQTALTSVVEGKASLNAAQSKPLLAKLSTLLEKHQESYEFCVVADMDLMDGLKVDQRSQTQTLQTFKHCRSTN